MLFTLQHILHVYEPSFGLLSHETMWQEYERDQWGPDAKRGRTAKGRLVSTLIPIERYTKKKMNGKVNKIWNLSAT